MLNSLADLCVSGVSFLQPRLSTPADGLLNLNLIALRIGPWVAKNNPGANWAGVLDWQARPEAMFLIKDLVLEGCKG